MDTQYKSIEYQFRDQRLYEDYYALYSIGWEYWRRRRSITGTVETLLISSVYSNIPFPGKELWCVTEALISSDQDRHF